MSVIFRQARADDLEVADRLVVRSINDLTERHGLGPMAVHRPPQFQLFSLNDDPGGLWIAEDQSRILGFAWSWVCGNLWFLAQLFVEPGQQGHGFGTELLRRTLQHAEKSGASNRALITFTFNTVSQGLYIRHGMVPRFPIYNFSVTRDVLLGRLQSAPLRAVRFTGLTTDLPNRAMIDTAALGVDREKHHRYLTGDAATEGFFLYAGEECVGYIYVNREGHIGPVAVVRPDAMQAAFVTALNLAAQTGSQQISAFIPGPAAPALTAAVEYGMRITVPMILLSSHGVADWTQYLPRNPGFM
jgi:GNAT superfamily N-acetyltransferase